MALQLRARVEVSATIDGTGNVTSMVANSSRIDFSFMSDADYTYGYIEQGALWEECTLTKSGTELIRSAVTASSAGGSSVSFSASSSSTVFLDVPLDKLLIKNAAGGFDNADPLLATITVNTITALKAVEIPSTSGLARYVRGNASATDGKGGWYYWDAADATAGDDYDYVVSDSSATGRWIRVRQQVDPATAANDAAISTGALARVSGDLRSKHATYGAKSVPEVENSYQGEFTTFAQWQALASTKWKNGDRFIFRGATSENDLAGQFLVFVWDASSTNTTALGVTQLRPDDIVGSNPGRAVLTERGTAPKFTNSDATPSLAGGRIFRCADTVPAAITALDDMVDGYPYYIFPGAQAQVFTNSASLLCPEGEDFTLTTTDSPIIAVSDNGVVSLVASVNKTHSVANKTALEALTLTASANFESVIVTDADYGGVFRRTTSDISTEVAADTAHAIYVPFSTGNGSTGGFVRVDQTGRVNVKWAGATGDGTTDDATAIINAVSLANFTGYQAIYLPRGDYKSTQIIDLSSGTNKAVSVYGDHGSTGDNSGVGDLPSRLVFSATAAGLKIRAAKGVTIQNVEIDMTSANAVSVGVYILGAWHSNLVNVNILNNKSATAPDATNMAIGLAMRPLDVSYTNSIAELATIDTNVESPDNSINFGNFFGLIQGCNIDGFQYGVYLTGAESAGGTRTNQNLFQKNWVKDNYVNYRMNGIGGGNVFIDSTAENPNSAADASVIIDAVSSGTAPVWIGGEIHGTSSAYWKGPGFIIAAPTISSDSHIVANAAGQKANYVRQSGSGPLQVFGQRYSADDFLSEFSTGNFVYSNDIDHTGGLSSESLAISSLASLATITPTTDIISLTSTSGVQTLNATTQIADGTYDGQRLILRGGSNTDFFRIFHGGNVLLDDQATMPLKLNCILELRWINTSGNWVEVSRTWALNRILSGANDTNIGNSAHSYNTDDKHIGFYLLNSSTGNNYYALGNDPTDPWLKNGSTIVTPTP